jgi:hypothetical protein
MDKVQLRSIAGLAYLWSAEGNELLRLVALNDSEPGLRQSALWAYGFAGGRGAEELLWERAGSDPDLRTRAFFIQALECLELNDGLWWKV